MKEIKAIIQPFMLDSVLLALEQLGELPGITVSRISGWGKERGRTAANVTVQGMHRFANKVKLEIVVRDDVADLIVSTIEHMAHSGNPGDGKIFVVEVAEAVKIRTGERGDAAL